MSETDEREQQETGDDTPTIESVSAKVDKLADTVASLVDRLHGKASEHEADKLDRPTRTVEGTREHAASLGEEIRAELAKLRQQEASEAKLKDLSGRVAKTEKALEKAPREYRRVERAMGWIRDEDR